MLGQLSFLHPSNEIIFHFDCLQMSELKNGYHFEKKLGDTVLGEVMLALNSHDRLVVVKLSSTKKYEENLKQKTQAFRHFPLIMENPSEEAKLHEWITQHAPHPHILRLLDQYQSEDGETHGMVLEYAPGSDLYFEVMGEDTDTTARSLPESRARKIFRQVVSAVHHLHRNGVAHLDISPENIFLDDQGDAKLADFGVARRLSGHDQDQLPPHVVFSKRFYMAPEVYYQRPFQPTKADVYSLGVTLLCLLAGSHPFYFAPQVFLKMTAYEVTAYLKRGRTTRVLSADALHLISSAMACEEHRMTSEQMLQHPFFQ